jgi:hypothetical protein
MAPQCVEFYFLSSNPEKTNGISLEISASNEITHKDLPGFGFQSLPSRPACMLGVINCSAISAI